MTRSGSTRRRICISAQPAPGPIGSRGPQAGRKSCVTQSSHPDLDVTNDGLLSILTVYASERTILNQLLLNSELGFWRLNAMMMMIH